MKPGVNHAFSSGLSASDVKISSEKYMGTPPNLTGNPGAEVVIVLMESESALKNIFRHIHPLIKGFRSPALRRISNPRCSLAVRGGAAVVAAAPLPPGAGDSIWAKLILILCLSGHRSLGSYSTTTTPSAGRGIPFGGQLSCLGRCCLPVPPAAVELAWTISIAVPEARSKATLFSLAFSQQFPDMRQLLFNSNNHKFAI